MKNIIAAVEKGMEGVLEHNSIRSANAAITLQALRSGGKGYTGEFIQVPLRAMAREVARQVFEYVSHDMKIDPYGDVTAEERRKSIVELYMEEYDEANAISEVKDPHQSQQDKGLSFD